MTDLETSRFVETTIARAPNGAIIALASDFGGITLARFSALGEPDRAFGINGHARIAIPNGGALATTLAVAPDGRVLVVGATGTFNSGYDWLVAAVDADGTPSSGFGVGGIAIRTPGLRDDFAERLEIQPDGRVIVVGAVKRGLASSDLIIARYLGFRRTCGDADGNAVVTASDGVQALRAAAGLASACLPEFCDVDRSGAVTVTDGVRVLRAAADLPSDLACPP